MKRRERGSPSPCYHSHLCPEEAILAGCKSSSLPSGSVPDHIWQGCLHPNSVLFPCFGRIRDPEHFHRGWTYSRLFIFILIFILIHGPPDRPVPLPHGRGSGFGETTVYNNLFCSTAHQPPCSSAPLLNSSLLTPPSLLTHC